MELTEKEERERLRLLKLQGDNSRPFMQEEWDRLKEVTRKLYSGIDFTSDPF